MNNDVVMLSTRVKLASDITEVNKFIDPDQFSWSIEKHL